MAPPGPVIEGPSQSLISRQAGFPGSTTSRAMKSASSRRAPFSSSMRATVLLPEAIPPVKPIMIMTSLLFPILE